MIPTKKQISDGYEVHHEAVMEGTEQRLANYAARWMANDEFREALHRRDTSDNMNVGRR